MKALNYIRVILVEPTHPGNIGATARAMANFGIEQLCLVNPHDFPSMIAHARAAGADWILEKAQVFDNLNAALGECRLVFGTTARSRSIKWRALSVEQAMQKALQQPAQHEVAIVFGRESRGLKNTELDCCSYLVRIDVQAHFSSLNLGSAVTVILYELYKQAQQQDQAESSVVNSNPKQGKKILASSSDKAQFFVHFEYVLKRIDFMDGRSTRLMRKIKHLFNKSELTVEEVNMLRGILSAINEKTKQP